MDEAKLTDLRDGSGWTHLLHRGRSATLITRCRTPHDGTFKLREQKYGLRFVNATLPPQQFFNYIKRG